jgi:hypothetical protein
MISREFLAKLSRTLAAAKSAQNPVNATKVFGGINVLITGDFLQFPAIACRLSAALFTRNAPGDNNDSITGQTLYKAFITVVIHNEQCHNTPENW